MDSPEMHPAVPGQTSTGLTVRGDTGRRLISAAEFQELADVPAAAEWLANVDNPNTRRAYGSDVGEFMSMLGIPPLRRAPTRPPGPRHRLAEDARGARSRSGDPAAEALGRLLPVPLPLQRERRRREPRLGRQAAPDGERERRPDPGALRRPGTAAPQRSGGGEPPGPARPGPPGCPPLPRTPARPRSPASRSDRSTSTGACRTSGSPARAPRPGRSPSTRPPSRHWAITSSSPATTATGTHPCSSRPQARWAGRPLTGDGIYKLVRKYASAASIPMERIVHALRATAATNALENEADIARVQDWLGHANVSTTRLYDRRDRRPEDSPTFRVSY